MQLKHLLLALFVPLVVGVMAQPANDCIGNAIDITTQMDAAADCFQCMDYEYSGTTDPTESDVIIGGVEFSADCGLGGNTQTTHFDIWFTFTKTPATPDTWITVYDRAKNLVLNIDLYSGTPVVDCGATPFQVTGLTHIDCANGSTVEGGALDRSDCTTPRIPRIDISGLADGTYFFRIYEEDENAPLLQSDLNLCIEPSTPRGAALEECPNNTATQTIGCMGAFDDLVNVEYSVRYNRQSNSGTMGNAVGTGCTDDLNDGEPTLATPAFQAFREIDDDCDGPNPPTGGLLYVNNVINNTAFYGFYLNAGRNVGSVMLDECYPVLCLRFENVVVEGSDGDVGQVVIYGDPLFQGTAGQCFSGADALVGFNLADGTSCTEFKTNLFDAAGIAGTFDAGAVPDGDYYLVVEGQDGALVKFDLTITVEYHGPMCNPAVTPGPCATPVVAVELMNFDASVTGTSNTIEWTTVSELNNSHFVVERSADGKTFEPIGKVTGQGTSLATYKYEFVDEKPYSNTYYRLQAVNFDGEGEYSEVISVSRDSKAIELSKVAPIPTSDQLGLEIQASQTTELTVQVVDLFGKVILEEQRMVQNGTNELSIDLSPFTAGVYYISVEGLDERIIRKVVKN